MVGKEMAQPYPDYRSNGWSSPRSPGYNDSYPDARFGVPYRTTSTPFSPVTSSYNLTSGGGMLAGTNGLAGRTEPTYAASSAYSQRPAVAPYHHHHNGAATAAANGANGNAQYGSYNSTGSGGWDDPDRYSPSDSVDDIINSPTLSDDYSLDTGARSSTPGAKSGKSSGKPRTQRRPSNRDEFDGPHQFLQRPPPEYIAMQERELPHLPINLHVQEQDHVLAQVNDRLSQCAFDFVAKYQFPIPLTQDMRPVERPQDREWTEWVYLLKRLATKRRIPARVLYNSQIKQLVTILENSLEMRHAAKHQSRPLKDDRNILQLISAGIQVAKILKDASAMDYLDKLYVSTEKQIQERSTGRFRS